MEATASSSSVTSSGMIFAPQLAIQADIARVWANCFISTKESDPWFALEFKSVTSIFNVWLGIRSVATYGLPSDYSQQGMKGLSVFVSNSSESSSHNKRQCGSPWTHASYRAINITMYCGRNVRGRFLHVMVPSTSPTYLLICSIVLNRESGNVLLLSIRLHKVHNRCCSAEHCCDWVY